MPDFGKFREPLMKVKFLSVIWFFNVKGVKACLWQIKSHCKNDFEQRHRIEKVIRCIKLGVNLIPFRKV